VPGAVRGATGIWPDLIAVLRIIRNGPGCASSYGSAPAAVYLLIAHHVKGAQIHVGDGSSTRID
jgi:hypothetical protein